MEEQEVGLHKGLTEILEGVSIPEEARGRGSGSGDIANQTDRNVRLDMIALLEKTARRKEDGASLPLPLKAGEQAQGQIRVHKESKEAIEECAVEVVDANRFASYILGCSRWKFWLLRKLGRIGPKPMKVNGTLKWELSSILRWIEWGCCNMAEFRAREERSRQEPS